MFDVTRTDIFWYHGTEFTKFVSPVRRDQQKGLIQAWYFTIEN